MITRVRARLRDDDGFSLTELLVVVLLLSLVLGVVAGVYLSSTRTQVTVQTVSRATTDAQSAVAAIDRAVRTATEVRQVDAHTIAARVPGSDDPVAFACMVWNYDPASDELRFRSFPDGTAVAAPSPTAVRTWTLLAQNVQPISGNAIYGWDGVSLAIAFQVTASEHQPVAIELTTTPLVSIEMETSRCA